jgi:hypothetical protein
MKLASILFCFFLFCNASAQKLQTVVPSQPVVVGTAFQVQYIVTVPSDLSKTQAPLFEGFTVVSGPNLYKGKVIVDGRLQPIENIAYTLVPERTGKMLVPGLHAEFKDGSERESRDAVVNVVAKPKVSFNSRSSFTDANLYAPSSEAELGKLIDENIFIRTEISKTSCYPGEAITASFKLYSRLQSTSEMVRVPGLYGFSVMDILDIRESHQAVETINGKVFNTSILRKVQLYPEQPGKLMVDEMVVRNDIEFDDSLDNDKKTIVHKELRSRPVVINVKSLPTKKPAVYNGAVGQFSVSMSIDKNNLAFNEQAKLKVTVMGKGNFIQLGEPSIAWPDGVEVFEPQVQDDLNTTVVPAQGKRTFTYGIAADSTGSYSIPPVSFAYFDPAKD